MDKPVGKCSLCGGLVYEDFQRRKTCTKCYAVEVQSLPTIPMEHTNVVENQQQFLTEG